VEFFLIVNTPAGEFPGFLGFFEFLETVAGHERNLLDEDEQSLS
jgi:hypothetical protein